MPLIHLRPLSLAGRRFLWGALQALLDSARKQGAGQAVEPAVHSGGSSIPSAGSQPPQQAQQEGAKGQGRSWKRDGGVVEATKPAAASLAFRQAYNAYAGRTPPESSIVSRLK